MATQFTESVLAISLQTLNIVVNVCKNFSWFKHLEFFWYIFKKQLCLFVWLLTFVFAGKR